MSHKKNAPNQGHHSLQGFSRCGCSDALSANVVPKVRKDHLLPVFLLQLPRMEQVKGGQLGLRRDEVGEEQGLEENNWDTWSDWERTLGQGTGGEEH